MKRNLIITDDGSHSIHVPELDENYHSTHGAIQESQHVFIDAGFNACVKSTLNILEVGFGTGLNALLALKECNKTNKSAHYFGLEKYPLVSQEYHSLNYTKSVGLDYQPTFMSMHECIWDREVVIKPNFTLCKYNVDANLLNFNNLPLIDLIFFDAFAPNKQNELWNQLLFKKIYDQSSEGAIFVTYCAKGVVRRDLQSVGFTVERIPGPPGKNEMLRAIK